jgi:hypothetical protein
MPSTVMVDRQERSLNAIDWVCGEASEGAGTLGQ